MKTICPHCNLEYPEIDDSLLDKKVECAECGEIFVVEKVKISQDGNNKTQKHNVGKSNASNVKKNTHHKSGIEDVLEIISWFFLAIPLMFLSFVILQFGDNSEQRVILQLFLASGCSALFLTPFFLFLAKVLSYLRKIEQNTRK